MKYISMIGVMQAYGSYAERTNHWAIPEYDILNRSLSSFSEFRPFTIKTSISNGSDAANKSPRNDKEFDEVSADTGISDDQQIIYELTQTRNTGKEFMIGGHMERCPLFGYRTPLPAVFNVLPILEIEWLKTKFEINETNLDILTQLSYLEVGIFLTWKNNNNDIASDGSQISISMDDRSAVMQQLELDDTVIEVEELEDTPTILYKKINKLPYIKLPKIRSWVIAMMYANNFNELYGRCESVSGVYKEIYLHVPMLLSMFMCDYFHNHLKEWSKNERLNMDNKLHDQISNMGLMHVNPGQMPTYATSSGLTDGDRSFLRWALGLIQNKIHDLNINIGIVSFAEYCRVRGPETTNATVRLCDMKIDWDAEMTNAKKRAKAESETDEDAFEDDVFDGFGDEDEEEVF